MAINYSKWNLTIVDETNISKLIKIDSLFAPNHDMNYYETIEKELVAGRYLYEKKTSLPIGYWFHIEDIDNYSIIAWNSNLKKIEFIDILIEFYKERCIHTGHTISILIDEKDIDVCNFLKKYRPEAKSIGSNVEFKFFDGFKDNWLDKELHVQN